MAQALNGDLVRPFGIQQPQTGSGALMQKTQPKFLERCGMIRPPSSIEPASLSLACKI
jgi:hypothetical protein